MEQRHIASGLFLLFATIRAFGQVADPVATNAGGPSGSQQTMLFTITDAASGASICYTTDGSYPGGLPCVASCARAI